MNPARREHTFHLWLLGLLLVALPLFSHPLSIFPREILGDAVSWRYHFQIPWTMIGFLIAAAWLGWLFLRQNGEASELRFPRGWSVALGCYAVVVLISFAASEYKGTALAPTANTLAALALAFVAMQRGRSAGFNGLLGCCVASTAVVLAYSLFQLAVVARSSNLQSLMESNAVATLGNRNLLASYLVFSIAPLVVWGFLSSRDDNPPDSQSAPNSQPRWSTRQYLAVVVLLGTLVVLYFCRSVAAWAGLALTAAIAAVVLLATRWPRRAPYAILGVALAVAIAAWLLLPQFSRLFQKNVRWEIWRASYALIKAHPVVGTGAGTFFIEYPEHRTAEYFEKPLATVFTDHAHCEWLETGSEMGILGMLALLAVWLYAAHQWWHKRSEMRPGNWAFAFGAIALMAHGSSEVNLRNPPGQVLVWLALGLSLSGLPLKCWTWKPLPWFRKLSGVLLALVCAATAYFFVWLPMKSDFHWRRAHIRGREGDYLAALSDLQAAVKAQPARVEAWYTMAVFLEQMVGATEEAKRQREILISDVLGRVKELAPDYRAVNKKVGLWLCRQGRFELAIPFLEREVALDKGNPQRLELRQAFADDRYWLARAYLDAGQREKSLAAVSEARLLDPSNQVITEFISRNFQSERNTEP